MEATQPPRPLQVGDVFYAFADGATYPRHYAEVVTRISDDGSFGVTGVTLSPAGRVEKTEQIAGIAYARLRFGDDAVVGRKGVVVPPLKPAYPGLLFRQSGVGLELVVCHSSTDALTVCGTDSSEAFPCVFRREQHKYNSRSLTLDGLRAAGYAPLWEIKE